MSHEHSAGCSHGHEPSQDQAAEPTPPSFTAPVAPLPVNDSIASQFSRAEQLFHHVVEDDPTCEGPHDVARHVADALSLLKRCAQMVRRDSLISRNERLEDINTENLRYLLVEYYIAALGQREPDMHRRPRALRAAKAGFELFIETCVRVGVISQAEQDELGFAKYLGGGDGDGMGSRGSASSGASSGGPALREGPSGGGHTLRTLQEGNVSRGSKIARFKRNAAAKKRLLELHALHAHQARSHAGGSETPMDGVTGAASAAAGGIDEEVQREMTVLALQMAARSAVDDIASIEMELPLVALYEQEHAAPPAAASGEGSAGGSQATDARMAPRGLGVGVGDDAPAGPPPGDRSIDPAREGLQVVHIGPTFEARRETVKADVFKLGHNPPTMSMEDWGDIVTAKRIAKEEREAKQAEGLVRSLRDLQETGDDDNNELYEKAQRKARNFDDWADGVPKGAGNTKRI